MQIQATHSKYLRDNLPWFIFLGVCFHLIFFIPSPTIIGIPRVKLYSGVVCAIALLSALWSARRKPRIGSNLEFLATIVLICLGILSGMLSKYPIEATYRTFVLWTSCAGGFWAARIVLASPERARQFILLTAPALGVVLILCLISYKIYGRIWHYHYVDTNEHALAGKIFMLWIGPLWLLREKSLYKKAIAIMLLLTSCAVFFLAYLKIAMLICPILLFIAVVVNLISLKRFLAIIIILSIPLGYVLTNLPPIKRFDPSIAPIFYRVEQYFVSFDIAKQNPILGIGLHTPRIEYIKNYEPVLSSTDKEKFIEQITIIRVSENIFFTFIADLGIPFFVIYTLCLFSLVLRLVSNCIKDLKNRSGNALSQILIIPLFAGLIHFLVWDGLLHPQEAWFFHVLLGLGTLNGQELGTDDGLNNQEV
jgi:hypothetical protein